MTAERYAHRGHEAAVRDLVAWLAAGIPHAILVTGPPRVGKTTLALDLAAALLCEGPAGERPCRACRGCRRVASGNHPDLHVLRPEGPGEQVRIGDHDDPEPGTVRHLVSELSLLPAEAAFRVAIVESAHRMNEDAQNALLRTLEEPPPGTVIVLCADDEDRLLPTIRSRCLRIRLGPVGARAIEDLLAARGIADAPTAARLARLAGGRPGLAVALARDPETVRTSGALCRRLLDLADAGPGARLEAASSLLGEAKAIARALADPDGAAAEMPGGGTGGKRAASRGRGARTPAGRDDAADAAGTAASTGARSTTADADATGDGASADAPADASAVGESEEEAAGSPARRDPPFERRQAARSLIDTWRIVARDVAVAGIGGRRELGDPSLLEESTALAERLPAGAMTAFLERLDVAERLIEANAGPELAVDTLLLAWPRPATPAAAGARTMSGR
jgi:DNA polymerase-3 subunit delta'